MGGALAEAKSIGLKITVVYVSSGEQAGKKSVREEEAQRVCKALKEESIFLRMPDLAVSPS